MLNWRGGWQITVTHFCSLLPPRREGVGPRQREDFPGEALGRAHLAPGPRAGRSLCLRRDPWRGVSLAGSLERAAALAEGLGLCSGPLGCRGAQCVKAKVYFFLAG